MLGRERLPDPTGVNPRFKIANDTRKIYRTGFVLEFPYGGVFLSSIVITDLSVANTTWAQGSDWTIDDTCYDDTAGSDAREVDSAFNQTLVKRIIITTTRPLPASVSLSYQSFYDIQDWSMPGTGDPLNVTPDTIGDLLARTSSLVQQQSTVAAQTAPTTATLTIYPEDLNEEISTNLIVGEVYTVNTSTGISLIRPKNGPFFRDSVVLMVDNNPLKEGVDYQVDTFDKNRTRKSRNTSGIYWAIMLLTPQAGNVAVTYHTVGGRVTQEDFITIASQVKDLTSFLSAMTVITPDSLALAPIIKNIFWRLDNQDTQMRRLLVNPNPTSATAGISVQKVFTATDSAVHWYSIATLYTVVAGGQIITADRFKGRVFFPSANVAWTFTVEANLNQGKLPFTFSTESILVDPGVAEDGTTNTATPVWPMLRAVWNSATSGIVLQIGVNLPNLTDTPVIEDLSTAESGWILDQSNPVIQGQTLPAPVAVADSGFTLPDGSSVWTGNDPSKAVYYVPPARGGYPAFVGKSDYIQNYLSTPFSGSSSYSFASRPAENFTKARIEYGTDDGLTRVADITLSPQRNATPITSVVGSGLIVYGYDQIVPVTLTIVFENGVAHYALDFANVSIPSTTTASIRAIRLNAE